MTNDRYANQYYNQGYVDDERSGGDPYRDDEYWDDAVGYDPDDPQGYYEPIQRRPRRESPVIGRVIAAFAVLAIVVAGALVWTTRQINPSGPQGAKVASVEIPAGSSFADVTNILEEHDIVSSAAVMRWYAKFNTVSAVRAGQYVDFRTNSSLDEAIDVLAEGPVPPKSKVVTIIPGMWLADSLEAIHKVYPEISVDALKMTLASGKVVSKYHPDPNASWEGYLLPETYQVEDGSNAQQILQKLVNEFDATLDELDYDKAGTKTGRTAAELVTIASMIERETGDPIEERAKIARVILNRLDKNMRLGIDATILYGLGRKGDAKPLLQSELKADGPYNSRLRTGLPPTAISLPSKASLEAAINPAEGDWIYYVMTSENPREHTFAVTDAEFQKAKAVCKAEGFC